MIEIKNSQRANKCFRLVAREKEEVALVLCLTRDRLIQELVKDSFYCLGGGGRETLRLFEIAFNISILHTSFIHRGRCNCGPNRKKIIWKSLF